ncbi:glutamyl-tRNA reductase [Sulfurimonas lithotrophica]|uniref:Glutamyl-tRNA reductase n=1 Tax=Sulfurimonas lithotrophica TaxID=2590022 RepID=A0A5P8P0D7_9BACT|nr:glutamyl-tRNA reductase [Sulfurimonas lithotrophica]QFR49071.1 glutamyl-tRNA reductase [Sulfurimonas lithotrophica]
MHYLTVSFSHKNSTIEIREKLTYPNEKSVNGCLTKLNSSDEINETILISTCNRMEIFCSCSDIVAAKEHVFNMLSERAGISIEELQERADVYDDSTAIHHLFSVASALDSIVIGETQIAGQLKDAFRFSYDKGHCDKKIARAVKSAFKCAAKVRNMTDISSKPVSVASVAVSKLKSVLDDIEGKKTLVIGVGEMSEITAKHMISHGADVYIMNRTKQKAQILADEVGAKVYDYGQLDKAVNEFEILYTATSSNTPIITDDMIKLCNYQRFWFDLAVPRDISCSYTGMIQLFTVDDLKSIVEENKGIKEGEARKAHGIVGRSVVEFFEWLDALNVEPMIKDIYKKAYKTAEIESKRAINNGYLPKEYEVQAKKMAEQTLKRFLHDMTSKMREVSTEPKSDSISGVMQMLANSENDSIPDKYKNMEKK